MAYFLNFVPPAIQFTIVVIVFVRRLFCYNWATSVQNARENAGQNIYNNYGELDK